MVYLGQDRERGRDGKNQTDTMQHNTQKWLTSKKERKSRDNDNKKRRQENNRERKKDHMYVCIYVSISMLHPLVPSIRTPSLSLSLLLWLGWPWLLTFSFFLSFVRCLLALLPSFLILTLLDRWLIDWFDYLSHAPFCPIYTHPSSYPSIYLYTYITMEQL